ncbi:hypothetical protein [Streptomyces sp. NPDC096311]|uniref:hypothetical protein n=1 Tax=Streptomyces sp. NPDC096311 TaxID=3366083 RepID=UPI0038002E16
MTTAMPRIGSPSPDVNDRPWTRPPCRPAGASKRSSTASPRREGPSSRAASGRTSTPTAWLRPLAQAADVHAFRLAFTCLEGRIIGEPGEVRLHGGRSGEAHAPVPLRLVGKPRYESFLHRRCAPFGIERAG